MRENPSFIAKALIGVNQSTITIQKATHNNPGHMFLKKKQLGSSKLNQLTKKSRGREKKEDLSRTCLLQMCLYFNFGELFYGGAKGEMIGTSNL